jgi:DNA-binding NarL/FixJ family response regulator
VKRDRLGAEALRHAVAQACRHAETMVCHTATEALALLRLSPVFLGLFGLTLPDMDGLDLLSTVAEEDLVERRLVVTGRHDERALQVLRQARIHGFFDSSADDAAALGAAIWQIVEGRGFYSPTYSGAWMGGRTGAVFLQQLLSKTELLVYAIIGDGSDDEAAAGQLGLRANTIRCHRQNIMRKLGVQSRAVLMQQAIRLGLVRILPDGIQRPGFERALAERRRAAGIR